MDYRQLKGTLREYLVPIRDHPGYKATNVLTRLLGHKYFPYVDDFRIDLECEKANAEKKDFLNRTWRIA